MATTVLCNRFDLAVVVEIDWAPTASDDVQTLRIEIFSSATRPNWYRCRIWRYEVASIQPVACQLGPGEMSDQQILVNWAWMLPIEEMFSAPSVEGAIDHVVGVLDSLNHG